MNGAPFSPLCYMLISFPLPACCFVVFSLWCWADAVFLRAPACIVCFWHRRIGEGKKKTHKKTGGRQRERESRDSCATPSFLQEPQLSGDVSKKAHFSIFDHGYYSCTRAVNLHHLMFLLSPNRIGWDGVVFVSNLSTLWHLQRTLFFFPSQFCHITASLAPSPPPVQTQTPPIRLGPVFVAYLIHFAVAFVCLAYNDGQDDHQMKCAVESVWVTRWQNEGICRGFAGCFQITNEAWKWFNKLPQKRYGIIIT